MYPRIVCNCGRVLGDLFDLFKAMRAAKYEAAYGTGVEVDPTLLAITDVKQVNLKDELDALCLTHACCRTRMLSQVEFREVY